MSGRQPTVVSRRILLDDVFRVAEVIVDVPEQAGEASSSRRYLSFERGDSVAAVVVHRERRTVLLVRQFRYAALQDGDGWLVEIVAGIVEDGESEETAIRREIEEEVGYRARELRRLGRVLPSPGASTERITIFATEVSDADRVEGVAADADEDIMIVELAMDDVRQALDEGRFTDAKTALGLLMLDRTGALDA
jgi:ADP-ribose pyrophosphatase